MNLIIDIGNTSTKVAIFERGSLVYSHIYIKLTIRKISSLSKEYRIKSVILSNSGKVSGHLLKYLSGLSGFLHLHSTTPLPIKNKYRTPETLGKDRLAAAVGAHKRFPDSASLIIDMGTCITLDFINSKGEFVGGNISPGMNMRLKAMHLLTASLPQVALEVPKLLFGNSTKSALQNGAVKGTFMEIDGFIDEVYKKYGGINVILTGGDALLFEKYTKNEIFVAPNLVLEGLNEILEYNAK